jgi:hypothetical protein
MYNTRATADVLIEAAREAGVNGFNYSDEVDFIQQRIEDLVGENNGNFEAGDLPTFWSRYLQYGGWWASEAGLETGNGNAAINQGMRFQAPPALEEGRFHLVVYPTHLGDGSGANRPHLQETPNPNTTVTWNSWIEINPETAYRTWHSRSRYYPGALIGRDD